MYELKAVYNRGCRRRAKVPTSACCSALTAVHGLVDSSYSSAADVCVFYGEGAMRSAEGLVVQPHRSIT